MKDHARLVCAAGLAGLLLTAGCGQSQSNDVKPAAVDGAAAAGPADHSHDGWWCDEHGVPEEICALCDPKLAAEFQKKGDWCAKHDRPDSQCFVCHPEFEAQFAARYEAKYGKKPPKPIE